MATLVARPVNTRTADDVYFGSMSILVILTVVTGFSRSYFLRGMVMAPLPSLLVHLHGLVFTSWVVLFAVQPWLIMRRNVWLHRRLGYMGAVIAVLMVILGISAIILAVRDGRTPPIFSPPMFLVLNIYGVLLFGALVAAAVVLRNNRPLHKRLMLLATLNLLPPATTRFFVFVLHKPRFNAPFLLAFTLSLLVFDLISRRRPYATTVIGSLLVLSVFPIANGLGHAEFMHRFAALVQQH